LNTPIRVSGVDTAFRVETPEGTDIDLHPAGFYARSIAFLIDESLRWSIILGTFAVTALLGVFGRGLALIVFFFCYWLYGVAFEVLNGGMTPGKRYQGLQVVHGDGTPITLPASLLRNLLLWVDLLPVFYVAGIVTMSLSQHFRRLGDLAAGTVVVYRRSAGATDTDADVRVMAAPSRIRLTEQEQRVLIDFLERADTLTEERRAELARMVAAPLELSVDDASRDVLALAGSLRGG
jgi:uncharacterized RDD family membrane protein YckC